jgi:hypothetical protein
MAQQKFKKARMKMDALALKILYTGKVLKQRYSDDDQPAPRTVGKEEYIAQKGKEFEVVAVDTEEKTVTVKHPIDPDKVLVLAAEAVELYNEGLRIWQSIVAISSAIGGFFAKVGSAIGAMFGRKPKP